MLAQQLTLASYHAITKTLFYNLKQIIINPIFKWAANKQMLMTLLVSVLTRMTAVTARSHCHHSCATHSMVACVAAGIILVLLP